MTIHPEPFVNGKSGISNSLKRKTNMMKTNKRLARRQIIQGIEVQYTCILLITSKIFNIRIFLIKN